MRLLYFAWLKTKIGHGEEKVARPDEVKDVLRHYVIRYQGPSGLTEQDDMENWGYAHEGARGTIARRYPFNYEMGMGYERQSWPITLRLAGSPIWLCIQVTTAMRSPRVTADT